MSFSSDDYVISLHSGDAASSVDSSSNTEDDRVLYSTTDSDQGTDATETESVDIEVSRMNMDQSNRFFSTEPQPEKPRHESRFVHIPGHIGY